VSFVARTSEAARASLTERDADSLKSWLPTVVRTMDTVLEDTASTEEASVTLRELETTRVALSTSASSSVADLSAETKRLVESVTELAATLDRHTETIRESVSTTSGTSLVLRLVT
jgi:hypothetical protein